jgi:hypothetical protein
MDSPRILYIDSKDAHLDEENAIVIHPQKLGLALAFEKEVFDKVIIKNSPTELLKSMGFFNIARCLKEGGDVELYLYQPILVLQDVEVGELEANAKLGGFTGIKTSKYEEWIEQNGVDTKIETVKMNMVKASK